jgi:DNA invertase Pin-like site-specific DNA recombinase
MAPKRPKFVIYYRVSTQKQGRSGLGLEAQQAAVEQYVAAHNGHVVRTFPEVESGKLADRPQLKQALLRCRQTKAVLLVAKLDRLSRNIAFLMNLEESGIKFQALDIPEANTLVLGVMIAMAQHERELISKRTQAALAARKARGQVLGTPAVRAAREAAGKPPVSLEPMMAKQPEGTAAGRAKQTARADASAAEISPMIEAAREAGHSTLRAIAAYLNEQGATTARDSQWTAAAVQRVQRRLANPARHK